MDERAGEMPEHTGEHVPLPARSVVPDLIGLGLADACVAAAWAGTSVNATSVARIHEPHGIVVAQSPSPGTRLKGSWRIHVLVSVPPAESEGTGA